MAVVAHLGLGSNVGDRRAQLQAAVDGLAERGVATVASSSTYETDPVGDVLDQPAFLNACLAVATDLDPDALLAAAKDVERAMGRVTSGPEYVRHGPRAIDVDVLLYDSRAHAGERLTVPHPALLERRFVLIPLLELDFALATPDGTRLADALAALPVAEGVRRAGPALALPVG
ncbi:2-amino-4-hydroxy-6-hydroxymethyldihydropteridine pyrophosphokinase [Baekduia alba]|uniref:2-amino-4-hydroxy-6- hydroxymethyldihydropteridine diphosphokinase n=1 Tax=Baekduia alba TaxID=2997333 RepID=UPI00234093C6|nr:2-amino-4-hydroxy-6-hydroxymethyldihydropteridine diphosphokinase [Baekduia alba]WCB95859.1 2-amino-4-hydroxy-6-hydroxymethyldihydropteridine pyrophosphokinase [Baekduia alba]